MTPPTQFSESLRLKGHHGSQQAVQVPRAEPQYPPSSHQVTEPQNPEAKVSQVEKKIKIKRPSDFPTAVFRGGGQRFSEAVAPLQAAGSTGPAFGPCTYGLVHGGAGGAQNARCPQGMAVRGPFSPGYLRKVSFWVRRWDRHRPFRSYRPYDNPAALSFWGHSGQS